MEEFENYQTEFEHLVIGLFYSIENEKIQLFFSLAKNYPNIKFAIYCSKNLQNEFNLIDAENMIFNYEYGLIKSVFRDFFIQKNLNQFLSLHNWIITNSIETMDELKKFQLYNEVVVLGLFDSVNNKNVQLFYSIALTQNENDLDSSVYSEDLLQVKYVITFNSSLFEELKLENDYHIVSFNKFDEGRSDFHDTFEKEKIIQFIKTNKFPLISEYSDEAADRIFEYDIEILILLFISKQDENFNEIYDEFKQAALKYRGRVLFVLNDIDLNENKERLKRYGITTDQIPALRLMSQEGIKYKFMSNLITSTNISKFLNDFFDKKLKSFYFSQDLPDDWDIKPVKIITAANLKKFIKDSNKIVLVLFYHPIVCSCEELFTIYDELGEHFQFEQNYLIAKMDFTLNQLEDIQIKSCHEIKLISNQNIFDYENDEYSLDSFIEFTMNN